MDRIVWTILVVGTVLVSSVAPTGVVSATDGGPSISIKVNGEGVEGGERVVVPEATVTVEANSNQGLSSVIIRVNGEDRGPKYPEGTTFNRTINPELHGGENSIQVIATDIDDDTASKKITIYRDSIPPVVELTNPFSVQQGYAFPETVTVRDPAGERNVTVRESRPLTIESANISLDGVDHNNTTLTIENAPESLDGTIDNDSSVTIEEANVTVNGTFYNQSTLAIDDADDILGAALQEDSVTIPDANITISGRVYDESNISDFSAQVIGNGTVQTTDLNDGSGFELQTTLGLGNSTLKIHVADEYGNERFYRTRILIEDQTDPTVEVLGWKNNSTGPMAVQVHATDDVAVHSLSVHADRQPERELIEPVWNVFDAGRDNVTVKVIFDLRYEMVYNLTFVAKDLSNNTSVVNKTLDYDPVTPAEAAVPDIRVNENESGFINDGTYLVSASVTNGSITSATLESQSSTDENVTAHAIIHDGAERENLTIYKRIEVKSGENTIIIRATDTYGVLHKETICVDTENESHWLVERKTTTKTSQPKTAKKTTTTDPMFAEVTAKSQEPLTPSTGASMPLSPAFVIVAIVTVALFLVRRAELE